MLQWKHVKTTTNRSEVSRQGTSRTDTGHWRQGTAGRPGHLASGPGPYNIGANSRPARCGARQRPPAATKLPRGRRASQRWPQKLGWASARAADRGGRKSLPRALGATSSAGGCAGHLAAASGFGGTAGPQESGRLGGVPLVGATWVAQGGSRYAAS